MATYNVVQAAHKTLSTTTVDTVNLKQVCDYIQITNFDGTNKCYVTFDGSTSPSAAGDDTYVIGTSATKTFPALRPGGSVVGTNAHTIKIIGNGGAYSIEGLVHGMQGGG